MNNYQLFQILTNLHPEYARFSYDYYKETNARNNRGVSTLKGLLLSLFTHEEYDRIQTGTLKNNGKN